MGPRETFARHAVSHADAEPTLAADNGPRARVPAVLCTCDTAREKSASAEAVDLITEARDALVALDRARA